VAVAGSYGGVEVRSWGLWHSGDSVDSVSRVDLVSALMGGLWVHIVILALVRRLLRG